MRNSSNVVLAKMNLNDTSSHVPTSQNSQTSGVANYTKMFPKNGVNGGRSPPRSKHDNLEHIRKESDSAPRMMLSDYIRMNRFPITRQGNIIS